MQPSTEGFWRAGSLAGWHFRSNSSDGPMALYALLESRASVWTLECHADVWSIFRLVYLKSKAGSLVCLASKTSHTFVLYSLQECEVKGKII